VTSEDSLIIGQYVEAAQKSRVVTPGNWKRVPEKPYAIGIEPFSTPWKTAENLEKKLP
jgi:hypothetical protein